MAELRNYQNARRTPARATDAIDRPRPARLYAQGLQPDGAGPRHHRRGALGIDMLATADLSTAVATSATARSDRARRGALRSPLQVGRDAGAARHGVLPERSAFIR